MSRRVLEAFVMPGPAAVYGERRVVHGSGSTELAFPEAETRERRGSTRRCCPPSAEPADRRPGRRGFGEGIRGGHGPRTGRHGRGLEDRVLPAVRQQGGLLPRRLRRDRRGGSGPIEAAFRTGKGYREGMEAAYAKFVEIVIEQPDAAHLVFVDSLSVGAAAVPLSRANRLPIERESGSFGGPAAPLIAAIASGIGDACRGLVGEEPAIRPAPSVIPGARAARDQRRAGRADRRRLAEARSAAIARVGVALAEAGARGGAGAAARRRAAGRR